MEAEEIRFQVAVSCLQGVLEAKFGVLGEAAPAIAVAESLRIADEFVKQWSNTPLSTWKPTQEYLDALDFAISKMSSYSHNRQVLCNLQTELKNLCSSRSSSSEQKNGKDNLSK